MWDTILLLLKIAGIVFCLLNLVALLVSIGFAVYSFGRDGAPLIADALLGKDETKIS